MESETKLVSGWYTNKSCLGSLLEQSHKNGLHKSQIDGVLFIIPPVFFLSCSTGCFIKTDTPRTCQK